MWDLTRLVSMCFRPAIRSRSRGVLTAGCGACRSVGAGLAAGCWLIGLFGQSASDRLRRGNDEMILRGGRRVDECGELRPLVAQALGEKIVWSSFRRQFLSVGVPPDMAARVKAVGGQEGRRSAAAPRHETSSNIYNKLISGLENDFPSV